MFPLPEDLARNSIFDSLSRFAGSKQAFNFSIISEKHQTDIPAPHFSLFPCPPVPSVSRVTCWLTKAEQSIRCKIKWDPMWSLTHKVTYALHLSPPFTVSQQQRKQQGSAQLDFSAIFLTSTPSAAVPGTPAFQTSFGVVDAASGPHQPEQHCIFVEVVHGAQLHTWLAGFSLCALEIAGYWPPPAGDPAHADKKEKHTTWQHK